MRRKPWLRLFLMGCLLATLGSCQGKPPKPARVKSYSKEHLQAAANNKPVVDTEDTAKLLQEITQTASQLEKQESNKAAAEARTKTTEPEEFPFEPPFPHRSDLFSPPNQGAASPRKASSSSAPTESSDVALKGFANVGGQHAVLTIGDELATLAADEERYGVRVVSLDPPQVTLQRGRHRWTLSLLPQSPAADSPEDSAQAEPSP